MDFHGIEVQKETFTESGHKSTCFPPLPKHKDVVIKLSEVHVTIVKRSSEAEVSWFCVTNHDFITLKLV